MMNEIKTKAAAITLLLVCIIMLFWWPLEASLSDKMRWFCIIMLVWWMSLNLIENTHQSPYL